jgi:tetratricopeptide (TPR) repeat protein
MLKIYSFNAFKQKLNKIKMKRLLIVVVLVCGFQLNAQTNSELIKHYEAYYKQMKKQGDVQGIINGMTHLNVLSPSQARLDTLAYIYMSNEQYSQALNTIGIEKIANDSDIAVQVKAVSLKALGQPKLAIGFFDEMFKRNPNALIAYELAELNLQTKNLVEAQKHIDYGLANAKDDMTKTYYETQTPYKVPLKSAFMYLNALVTYNKDTKANIDAAVDILDATLKTAPNFNLIQLTKNELLRQKQALQAAAAQPKN